MLLACFQSQQGSAVHQPWLVAATSEHVLPSWPQHLPRRGLHAAQTRFLGSQGVHRGWLTMLNFLNSLQHSSHHHLQVGKFRQRKYIEARKTLKGLMQVRCGCCCGLLLWAMGLMQVRGVYAVVAAAPRTVLGMLWPPTPCHGLFPLGPAPTACGAMSSP